MQLFTQQELNALASLLQRTPMASAEALWAQEIHRRLVEFCTQEKPKGAGTDNNSKERYVQGITLGKEEK